MLDKNKVASSVHGRTFAALFWKNLPQLSLFLTHKWWGSAGFCEEKKNKAHVLKYENSTVTASQHTFQIELLAAPFT